jgi:hypothetical protein
MIKAIKSIDPVSMPCVDKYCEKNLSARIYSTKIITDDHRVHITMVKTAHSVTHRRMGWLLDSSMREGVDIELIKIATAELLFLSVIDDDATNNYYVSIIFVKRGTGARSDVHTYVIGAANE